MTHHPDDSAGAQLALAVAVKLLLSAHRSNPQASAMLEEELEHMRAGLLGSSGSDRKLHAFDETAEALLQALRGG